MTVLIVLAAGLLGESDKAVSALDHATYKSGTGGYSLVMKPNNEYRSFSASYRFTKEGTLLWSAELPFTLWDAVVTENGMVVGYAYPGGFLGRTGRGSADLIVEIIDNKGKVLLHEVSKRTRYARRSPPHPTVNGIILDEPNDRVVFRLLDNYYYEKGGFWQLRESWRCYRLSTATLVETINPFTKLNVRVPDHFLKVVDARLVAGTPLILVHWVHECQGLGAIFTLVDSHGEHVWSLELPQDYEGLEGEAGERIQRGLFAGKGAILQTDQPGRFEVFFTKASQRVTFAANESTPGHWAVTETGRKTGSWVFQD